MTRTAWMHCFAGISAESAMGGLVDAGADLGEVRRIVERLPIGSWAIGAEPVQRAGLEATQVVVVHDDDPALVRTFGHVSALIEEARLPDRVRERSLDVLTALAQVSAALHRVAVQRVQLHGIGDSATIIAIVGTCAALEVLGIDELTCSPIAQGTGVQRTRSSVVPIPSPAVLGLLAERAVPTYGHELPVDLTTPAGAAIVTALASGFGPMPRMRPGTIGYGAQDHDLDGLPSVVQVVIGERIPREHPGQRLVQLDTNVDDVSGVVLAHTISALIDAGAIDAWITPTVAGRSRPMQVVSVICDPVLVEQIATVLLRETGALGVRSHAVERWSAGREQVEVDVGGYPLLIKVGPGRVRADMDDAAMIAKRTGLPLREVLNRAEAAWRRNVEVRQLHPAAQPQTTDDAR